MRAYDLLEKKKNAEELSSSEITFLVEEYVKGNIPDYQMSAFLMAACIQGLTERETKELTRVMRYSGEQLDLSGIDGITVDKHSTGGVGDKTTLILVPALAALGAKVMKMSGRGLGFTGGTIDKLESIPGFRTELAPGEAISQVNRIGACIVGQSEKLAPADKKIYALRDLTATVESIPLIASSIMSKKLAAGTDGIVLDVTCGSGAFMKTPEQAEELASLMMEIGRGEGRRMAALITNMDIPLGHAVGNLCEVWEAMEVLQGRGPEDLRTICAFLGGAMWKLCRPEKDAGQCREEFLEVLRNGSAWNKFQELVSAQGGRMDLMESLPQKPNDELTAWEDGYIVSMDTAKIGKAAMLLGAGRERKEDRIDPLAGLIMRHKTGERLHKGAPLVFLYTRRCERLDEVKDLLRSAICLGDSKPEEEKLIYTEL